MDTNYITNKLLQIYTSMPPPPKKKKDYKKKENNKKKTKKPQAIHKLKTILLLRPSVYR